MLHPNSNRKEVLLFSTSSSLAGNLLYLLHDGDKNLLIVGRLIAGMGAGTVFIAYAHITRVSKRGAER
jgi:predicted MFS family arabinose efflux permease